jgi:hypothetical protein
VLKLRESLLDRLCFAGIGGRGEDKPDQGVGITGSLLGNELAPLSEVSDV